MKKKGSGGFNSAFGSWKSGSDVSSSGSVSGPSWSLGPLGRNIPELLPKPCPLKITALLRVTCWFCLSPSFRAFHRSWCNHSRRPCFELRETLVCPPCLARLGNIQCGGVLPPPCGWWFFISFLTLSLSILSWSLHVSSHCSCSERSGWGARLCVFLQQSAGWCKALFGFPDFSLKMVLNQSD